MKKSLATMAALVFLAVLVLLTASSADAGIFGRRAARGGCVGGQCGRPAAPAAVSQYGSYQQGGSWSSAGSSQYGSYQSVTAFGGSDPLAQVNAIRAAHGLAPFAYDPGLAASAAANNAAQASRGLGHHVVSGAQVAAGTGDPASAARMWLASPAHRAIILGPYRCAGGQCSGGYSTLEAR